MTHTALVIDDHPITHAGCRRLLSQQEIETVLGADDKTSALEIAKSAQPDLIFLDISLQAQNGLDLIKPLLEAASDAAIIVFTMQEHIQFAARALSAGAKGYLSKNAPPEEFQSAVKTVLEGQTYLHHDFAIRLATMQSDPLMLLTEREEETLRLLGQGENLQTIALQLNVSYKTVANMISNLKSKLGVTGTNGLIKIALTHY